MRCDRTFANAPTRQSGAALIVCLTLVSAIALLAAGAMRALTLDTATTGNFLTHVTAALATSSGIESTIAAAEFPSDGELTHRFRFGANEEFETTVVVRYLGEGMRSIVNADGAAHRLVRHFEIEAETHGPRNSSHRRRRYWFTPVLEEP